MNLKTLLEIAGEEYPEIANCYLAPGLMADPRYIGDGLAYFIAREIHDLYDPNLDFYDQMNEIVIGLDRAISDLQIVAYAFERAEEEEYVDNIDDEAAGREPTP